MDKLSQLWIKHLITDLSDLTMSRLGKSRELFLSTGEKDLVERLDSIIYDANFCKEHVPSELKVYDTIFTQATIVGQVEEVDHYMPLHFDQCDVVSCIVTFDENVQGGDTIYYSGVKATDPDKSVLNIPFAHDRIQIGTFCSLLHGVSD